MYSLLSSLVFEANIAGFERTGVSDLFELAAMPIPDRRTSGKEGNNVFYFNSALTLTARIVNGVTKKCFCIGLEAVTKMAVMIKVKFISLKRFFFHH